MKTFLHLILNDLYYSIKNKGFYLIIFIPLFIFISEKLLDKNKPNSSRLSVAVLENATYPKLLASALRSGPSVIDFVRVDSELAGRALVLERSAAGFLNGENLMVYRRESPETLTLLTLFANLQRSSESQNPAWIASVQSLHSGGWTQQTLPTWILMLVLLVAFIILPAQVAEEKEKKLVFAILQTPVTELQWVVSKIVLGSLLALISVMILHVCSGSVPIHLGLYGAFLILGILSFSSVGVFLGFLCRNQSSARTLGFMFYLPLLLPSALADFSRQLRDVAPWVPSFQFYQPLQGFISDANLNNIPAFPWIYLLMMGGLFFMAAYFLIRKRWLMS